jgi:hypothetical protein
MQAESVIRAFSVHERCLLKKLVLPDKNNNIP